MAIPPALQPLRSPVLAPRRVAWVEALQRVQHGAAWEAVARVVRAQHAAKHAVPIAAAMPRDLAADDRVEAGGRRAWLGGAAQPRQPAAALVARRDRGRRRCPWLCVQPRRAAARRAWRAAWRSTLSDVSFTRKPRPPSSSSVRRPRAARRAACMAAVPRALPASCTKVVHEGRAPRSCPRAPRSCAAKPTACGSSCAD